MLTPPGLYQPQLAWQLVVKKVKADLWTTMEQGTSLKHYLQKANNQKDDHSHRHLWSKETNLCLALDPNLSPDLNLNLSNERCSIPKQLRQGNQGRVNMRIAEAKQSVAP